MSEKRILIPKSELDWDMLLRRNNIVEGEYEGIEEALTRPITPEDIRSCFRRANQWTDKENAELSDVIIHYGANLVADKVLDIALRPAPEPDPWDALGQAISAVLMNYSEHMGADELALAKAWNRLKATRKEDE